MKTADKMTNTEKFDALWHHVTGPCGHKPSAMMKLVGKALCKAVGGIEGAKNWGYLDPARNIAERIAKHASFQEDGTAFFEKVECEWPIRNADLELWSHLCLFGDRDYFPEEWEFLGGDIGSALKNARVWQTYERYVAGGRLTEDHRKLLAGLIWDQDVFRGDWVSLYVQGKRPFGDSSRAESMAWLLGWEWPDVGDEEGLMPADLKERAWELFDELRFAINDAIKAGAGK